MKTPPHIIRICNNQPRSSAQGRLVKKWKQYLHSFERRKPFDGPPEHFHCRTMVELRRQRNVLRALRKESFLDSLYAVLTAWGMHRLGTKGPKLVDFESFCKTIRAQQKKIAAFEGQKLWEMESEDEVYQLACEIWQIIKVLQVGKSADAKLTGGTKVLHHLLPDLVPPIDHSYAQKWFGWKNFSSIPAEQEQRFIIIIIIYWRILRQIQPEVAKTVGKGMMNTSVLKVIDNAIVGARLASRS